MAALATGLPLRVTGTVLIPSFLKIISTCRLLQTLAAKHLSASSRRVMASHVHSIHSTNGTAPLSKALLRQKSCQRWEKRAGTKAGSMRFWMHQ